MTIKSMNVYKNGSDKIILSIGLINDLVYCLKTNGEFELFEREYISGLELIGNAHATPELIRYFSRASV